MSEVGWDARDASGQRVAGVLEACTLSDAATALAARGLHDVRLHVPERGTLPVDANAVVQDEAAEELAYWMGLIPTLSLLAIVPPGLGALLDWMLGTWGLATGGGVLLAAQVAYRALPGEWWRRFTVMRTAGRSESALRANTFLLRIPAVGRLRLAQHAATLLRASLLAGMGRSDEAVRTLERLADTSPEEARRHRLMAASLPLAAGRWLEGIDALERSDLATEPDVRVDIAQVRALRLGEAEAALADLATIHPAQLEPSVAATAYLARSVARHALHRDREALSDAEEAHKRLSEAQNPLGAGWLALALGARAVAHARLDELARAEELFREALPQLVASREYAFIDAAVVALAGVRDYPRTAERLDTLRCLSLMSLTDGLQRSGTP